MSNNRYYVNRCESTDTEVPQNEVSSLSYVFNPNNQTNAKPDDASAISGTLIYVAISKYGDDWISLPHSHTFSEIFYITKGSGQFIVENKAFPIKEDDLVIMNPLVEHTERSTGTNALEYIVLGVDGLAFRANQQKYIVLNNISFQSNMHLYFNALANEMRKNHPYRDYLCQNLLNIIFTLILRNESLDLSIVSSSNISKECSIARNYIDNHFRENITLDTLTSLVHLNKYYFVHNFSKQYGISPINYLLNIRIEESKHLLANTNYSLSSISQIVGFSSPSYFSQAFKRITNMSPLEYKKNCS